MNWFGTGNDFNAKHCELYNVKHSAEWLAPGSDYGTTESDHDDTKILGQGLYTASILAGDHLRVYRPFY